MSPCNRLIAVLVAFFACSAATAQALPEGWVASGEAPQEYRMGRAADARHQGEYGASIVHASGTGESFGTLMQAVKADPYRGKRIVLKAWLKTQAAESAQLWMRVDGVDATLSMDNMDDRPVKGTVAWKEYEIVMDIPVSANHLAYGVLLHGKGALAIDEVRLDAAPASASVTTLYDAKQLGAEGGFTPMKRVLDAPINLDFEK